ncbi:multicopper oxidase family protein [Crossiella cryophila]|uniref:FtsP/CotA-like multicopper oxidase with cupredoxin domain n=1 Tax=Crossiella cryophila TaxID=43355 RepID=A0A7W7FTQ0_9PSEU|nr:multicopper oxidase family protein [Crossiella cryophila]MBB4675039.1 FtsP/CotA-like multicopper oxidase with cupredoxin domain [Crossiella cryophila]
MYALGFLLEMTTSLLLLPPLLLWARAVRRLPDARNWHRAARAARRRYYYVLALLVLKLLPAALLLGHGLAFGIRPLRTLVLLGVPLIMAARSTLPALNRAIRAVEPTPELRLAVTAPAVVLPARLAAVSGGLLVVLNLVVQETITLWLAGLVFALVALVVVIDVNQRHRRLTGQVGTIRWSPWARLAAPLVLVVAAAGCGAVGSTMSAFPDRLSMNAHGHHGASTGPTRSVKDLIGGPYTGPVRKFTVVADETRIPLASGQLVDAWTFGGTLPGLPLRVRQGETIELKLVNRLEATPTTIHWHGVDVPNAMDGVAGVTQDAVQPGGEFTYRFRAEKPGTYWYHSHQVANEQVTRGLFGALVIEPAAGPVAEIDETLLVHNWNDRLDVRKAEPGRRVRLRVVNANSGTERLTFAGAPFRVAAVDGQDLNEPGEIRDRSITLGGGGRADLDFTMPAHPVRIGGPGTRSALVLSPDGVSTVEQPRHAPELDLNAYGKPKTTPFGPDSAYTKHFTVDLDQGMGFHAGRLGLLWTVDGRVFPDAPMLMVREGDLVRMTFRNKGMNDHPMHLHGHHVLALSRDGTPFTGSPLWLDTVLVRPGETWEVAFRADNPGIWMDHCHDLLHASNGMTLHLGYEGVRTPFTVGSATGNKPE